jgi:hypothetical protein
VRAYTSGTDSSARQKGRLVPEQTNFMTGVFRWLGFAADFVSSVFGGGPVGITTDMPPTKQPSDDGGSTDEVPTGEERA